MDQACPMRRTTLGTPLPQKVIKTSQVPLKGAGNRKWKSILRRERKKKEVVELVPKRALWLPAPFCQFSLKVVSSNFSFIKTHLHWELFLVFWFKYVCVVMRGWEGWHRSTEEKAIIISSGNMMGVVMLNGGLLEKMPFGLSVEGWVDFKAEIEKIRRVMMGWQDGEEVYNQIVFFFNSLSKNKELPFWIQAFAKLFKIFSVLHGRKSWARENLHSLAWRKTYVCAILFSWKTCLFFSSLCLSDSCE